MSCPECSDSARFAEYRSKNIVSLIGEMRLARGYYHCQCGRGQFPWDRTLRLSEHRLTPGTQEVVCLAGIQESFGKAAKRTLVKLAGLRLIESTVERTTETAGTRLGERLAAGEPFGPDQRWDWHEDATGKTWATQFRQLPNLEQVARDGGKGLAKGVMLVNAQREQNEKNKQNETAKQEPIVDQGDHFHAFRPGGVSLSRFARRAQKALTEAKEAQKDLEKLARQGKSLTGATSRARHAWLRAEQAMDEWMQVEKDWTAAKKALELITPKGELNTRAKAEAKLAEILPRLPEPDFAKAKRQLEQPTMLGYLNRVESELAKLEMPAEVKQAAIEQESLRRCPELLEGESAKAAAVRVVMLTCEVILSAAGNAGVEAVASVREIFGRAYRASSLVECINSVLRMHQAQHRKMSQELLDLMRLYWNGHEFRKGRRKGKTPYELLGVPWPREQCWWDLLKTPPEQLRDKLSTMKNTA